MYIFDFLWLDLSFFVFGLKETSIPLKLQFHQICYLLPALFFPPSLAFPPLPASPPVHRGSKGQAAEEWNESIGSRRTWGKKDAGVGWVKTEPMKEERVFLSQTSDSHFNTTPHPQLFRTLLHWNTHSRLIYHPVFYIHYHLYSMSVSPTVSHTHAYSSFNQVKHLYQTFNQVV